MPGATEDTLLERLFSYYGPQEADKKGRRHPCRVAALPACQQSHLYGSRWNSAASLGFVSVPDNLNLASPTLRPKPTPAQQQTAPFSPGTQPQHQLGRVQCRWLAELHQAEPSHPECPSASAGLPEVRMDTTPSARILSLHLLPCMCLKGSLTSSVDGFRSLRGDRRDQLALRAWG